MADTSIEWADKTWNPLLGCERVTAGCDSCYAITTATIRANNPHPKVAEAFAGLTTRRFGRLDWTGRINLLPDRLTQPLGWKKPQRIFVNSQSDLFHKDVPTEFIAQVFAVMAVAERHTFQLLTKRHGRMRSLLNDEAFKNQVALKMIDLTVSADDPGSRRPVVAWPLPNLHVGVSVEDQKTADLRIPALLDTPAAVRWLSCEPLLGPVKLPLLAEADGCTCGGYGPPYYVHQPRCGWEPGPAWGQLHWVVVGGETGAKARPMHPDWARSLRDQCTDAEVPFFFKQWGDHLPVRVEKDSNFAGGRYFKHPNGGRYAATIRERSTKAFHPGVTRAMRAGDVNGLGHMLDDDTIAVRVGKKRAGRLLDGREWNEFPAERTAVTA
ncbi:MULTISPECIES: phage Gp37/Gp68 family protein [unclassified Micromonospora]|uniref:DUF5131 family protein n=1 Tax=unclassified Micromonospora TaxID=2617518 RepID=UPI0033232C6B